jgi:hypothetical protein
MTIPVNLATEDELSEAVLRRLLDHADRGYAVGTAYGRRGFGYLRNTITSWNRAARFVPFVVLTDLDLRLCPAELINEWLAEPRHPNLLLRVAVREVESWLLADRSNLAQYLRVSEKWIPVNPDGLPDPKAALVDVARRSRSRAVRERIVPNRGSTAKQGRDYNSCLVEFVRGIWNIEEAAAHSASLQGTVAKLGSFSPVWRTGV